MADENLDPTREEKDPGYLEDAAAEDETSGDENVSEEDKEQEDQRAPFVHDPEVHGRDYRVEGNDVRDYVGVDPEYRTYANEYDAPVLTDVERFTFTNQYDHLEGNADEEETAADGERLYDLTDEQKKILADAGQPVEDDKVEANVDTPSEPSADASTPEISNEESPEQADSNDQQVLSPTL